MEVLDYHVYMKGRDKCWYLPVKKCFLNRKISGQSHWECSDCEIQDYLKT